MFFKPLQYILALSCASSLTMVVSQETTPSLTPAVFTNTFSASPFTLPPSLATIGTSLTPAVFTNTFSASPYTLPPSLASPSTTVVSSSSQTPATTRAVSTASGTRTTSQTPTGTESAATTSSSSAARKLDQGSWIPVVFAVMGGLHFVA
ncbi:hypothetical protein BKA61DRAFT_665157 [Leptodontidium sp. MPI-SDFR-AT-0119]|nr:hypothetical protein BKA61DRAFT_665157 [Leptodontidium sp. MPI-SDFR-AT-0119]